MFICYLWSISSCLVIGGTFNCQRVNLNNIPITFDSHQFLLVSRFLKTYSFQSHGYLLVIIHALLNSRHVVLFPLIFRFEFPLTVHFPAMFDVKRVNRVHLVWWFPDQKGFDPHDVGLWLREWDGSDFFLGGMLHIPSRCAFVEGRNVWYKQWERKL